MVSWIPSFVLFPPYSLTSFCSFMCKLPWVSFMLVLHSMVSSQSVPKNKLSPAAIAPQCTLMLPFLLSWRSPLPPHHPLLKPSQSWPLPLSCFPQSHQWQFTCSHHQYFCSFDNLFGGAQHRWLLTPSFSFFSASIAGFSCSRSHLNP